MLLKTDADRLVEECVFANLGQAVVIDKVQKKEGISRDDYWECCFLVAWRRERTLFPPHPTDGPRNCGRHLVVVNSNGESMATGGHYDLTRKQALAYIVAAVKEEAQ